MKLKPSYRLVRPGLVVLPLMLLAACSRLNIGTETAYVISSRMTLRSSTAKVFRSVGELKNGDQVTILERLDETGRSWARLRGPDGQTGWADARFLVSEEIVDTLRRMADDIRDIPAQAVGQARDYIRLRLSPDRSSTDNSVTRLPAGTVFEIIERQRKPRPSSLENQSSGTEDNEDKDVEQKFDEWYLVRIRDNQVLPVGWVYGGTVRLDVPDEISYYASAGHYIIGWQKLGTVTDASGRSGGAYLVLEKAVFPDDKDKNGTEDFNRVQIISWDAERREYFTPLRENLRGRFPVTLKTDGSRGQFQIRELDKNDKILTRECSFELAGNGRVTVTGLKASDRKKR